jgi:fermentation-respiration switch protein FrsA (DUF1100 family)
MTRSIRSLAVAALVAGTSALGACSLDENLFNERQLDEYALSNAIIPDSLREEGAWQVGDDTVAWVFARRPGSAPRLTLLFCHGNKYNIAEYWPRVETLWQAGFDVLTFDYRGYGKSTGTSNEATLRADSEAALAELRTRGVGDSALVIHGFSLGGVCAIHLAARVVTPRALLVEAAFTSAEDLVRSGTVLDVPGRWLMKDPYDNRAAIRLVTAPTLIVHGDADTFLPFRFGEALHAAATGANPRALVRVPGANHTEIPERLGPGAYGALLHDFAASRGTVASPR